MKTDGDTNHNQQGILKFNLQDHYAAKAFRRSFNSTGAYLCLFDLSEYLRGILKYDSNLSKETQIEIEKIQSEFFDLLSINRVDLDDLE